MKNSNNDTDAKVMSRRKALSRLGGVAIMAYSVPALTTLSMAHAASSASKASKASDASDASEASDASNASDSSGPSAAKGSGPEFDACGSENLADPDYVQCLTDNGFEVPA